MKPIQSLDEAHKYLLFIADALYSVSSSFHIEKQDKTTLEKYANDLAEYAKGIETIKNSMVWKEEMKQKMIEEEQDNLRS
jgi:hypothetical protein